MNNSSQVVGIEPCLPGFLANRPGWTTPVRAEGLAALRIGVGLVLLFDVLVTYLPFWQSYFGPNSLGGPAVFGRRLQSPHWFFSWARYLPEENGMYFVLCGLAVAAAMLALGVATRWSAAVAWTLTFTVMNENYYLHNGGDRLRLIMLFLLIVAPSDATWSLSSWWRSRREGNEDNSPTFIYPWANNLLILQMTLLYFMNGVYKVIGPGWLGGDTLYYVTHDIWWCRWSPDWLPVPFVVTQVITWGVLAWELAFPVLIFSPRWRTLALFFGAMFHIGSGIAMNLGMFPLYALCLYLPELPWAMWRERLTGANIRPQVAWKMRG